MIIIKDKTMHLIYSIDDGGYYWQRLDTWQTSQIFSTGKDAILARQHDELTWE